MAALGGTELAGIRKGVWQVEKKQIGQLGENGREIKITQKQMFVDLLRAGVGTKIYRQPNKVLVLLLQQLKLQQQFQPMPVPQAKQEVRILEWTPSSKVEPLAPPLPQLAEYLKPGRAEMLWGLTPTPPEDKPQSSLFT